MQETLRRMPLPNEFTGGDGLNTAVIRFTRRVEGLDLANGNGTDVNRDQYTLRVDHRFNSSHRLSVIGTKEKTWSAARQAVQRSGGSRDLASGVGCPAALHISRRAVSRRR
jgi:hypothetical protein